MDNPMRDPFVYDKGPKTGQPITDPRERQIMVVLRFGRKDCVDALALHGQTAYLQPSVKSHIEALLAKIEEHEATR